MKMPKREQYEVNIFEELPSTHLYLKERYQEKRNRIVSAYSQTLGMGTKGRSFSSQTGGVYLSVLTFYEDFPSKQAFEIMQNCAVSVCETLSAYGIEARIKWPNDIHANGKKICGILIENRFEQNKVRSSLVGIGVNVYNPLPEDLSGIATNMSQVLGTTFDRVDVEEVREKLLQNLFTEKSDLSKRYQSYLGYVGEEIILLSGDERIPATLLSVTDTGGLIAKTAEGEKIFYSAEVSLRLKREEV